MLATRTNKGAKHLVEIQTGEGKIVATAHHPFWLPDEERWADASDLRPGSVLQTPAGTRVRVAAVKNRFAITRVHNLTVDDIHTYYVLVGKAPVLVHNSGGCPKTLIHYTDEAGMNGIVESKKLNVSTKEAKSEGCTL